MSILMLVGLLAMVALAGVDALRDKTPRSPRREWWAYIQHRPALEFWAERRSKRERAAVALSIGEKVG